MSNVRDPTPSNVAPRGRDPSAAVWYKLGIFSTAMFVAPLAAYYGAKDRYLGGNATYAGGLAAVVANVVLIGYIVMAFLEDDGTGPTGGQPMGEKKEADEKIENKKDR
jgi:vacuolar ATPase assembly integral membrane protein VMA21